MRKFTLLSLSFLFFISTTQAQFLQIYHIDVGQGDSTLVMAPSGKTLLIDGGDTGKGTSRVLPVLQALKVTALDFTVATHYDADHIGGLDEVIRSLPGRVAGKAYDRGGSHATGAFRQYTEAVGDKRTQIAVGERIDMGESVEVICVAVNQKAIGEREVTPAIDDENGNSVALLIRMGDFDYFVGGDLTGGGRSGSKRTPDVETLVSQAIGDVDVLRVSHHGSDTSSNQGFLTALRPEVGVISVGNGGRNAASFRHPRRSVLTRLESLRPVSLRSIFTTERGETDDGLRPQDMEFLRIAEDNVVITTNGRSYTVNGSVFATDGVRSMIAVTPGGTAGGGNGN